jgi:hypothetical protein
MALSFAGNGTITGLSVGGLPDGTVDADTLASGAGGIASSDQSVCKAWVNFNGETFATRDSYNVSSVTDNGTGDYTVNIDTDMANVNYSVVGCAGDSVNTIAGAFVIANIYAVGSIGIKVLYAHSQVYDRKNVNIAIFGD